MAPRLLRAGPLPESHLVQFRIKRSEDPELFHFIESIPYGEIAKTLREVIKRGIASNSPEMYVPDNSPSTLPALDPTSPPLKRVPTTQAIPSPGHGSPTPVAPENQQDGRPLTAPPLSDERIDASLMQLLADEDSLS